MCRPSWTARILGIVFLSVGVSTAIPQTAEKLEAKTADATRDAAQEDKATLNDPNRREAFDLKDKGKSVDAMPLFEKVVAAHPSDIAAREAWAWLHLCLRCNNFRRGNS